MFLCRLKPKPLWENQFNLRLCMTAASGNVKCETAPEASCKGTCLSSLTVCVWVCARMGQKTELKMNVCIRLCFCIMWMRQSKNLIFYHLTVSHRVSESLIYMYCTHLYFWITDLVWVSLYMRLMQFIHHISIW